MRTSIVKDKSYGFALRVIRLGRRLREEKEYEIASQFLLRDSKALPADLVNPALKEAEELLRILTAIVKTAQNINNSKPRTNNS